MKSVSVLDPRDTPAHTPMLTVGQMKAQVQLIHELLKSVMQEGVHYGIVPGTDKPSLLKPGAEKICFACRISTAFQIEELPTFDDSIRFRVKAIGTHIPSGQILGEGVGEAWSNEAKYKWRRAGRTEWEATSEERRRIKYGYNSSTGKEYEDLQVRTEAADQANTIIKMGQKRAHVAMTLLATAASDIFAQDLEDAESAGTEGGAGSTGTSKRKGAGPERTPQRRSGGTGNATAAQVGLIMKRLEAAAIPAADFCKQFEVEAVASLPFAKVTEALTWIGQNTRPGDRPAADVAAKEEQQAAGDA